MANPSTIAPSGIVTACDRRLAIEHWLLSACSSADRARMEWQQHGITMLRLGGVFSAVRLPGRLVYAAAASARPDDVDPFLEDALDGGPVICDPHGPRYYALVPAGMPRKWRAAADDWEPLGVECLGHGAYMGVPRVTAVEHNPNWASYWSVPMPSAGVLCPPLALARLIAEGARRLAEATPTLVIGPRP
ncbi:hypothetical protein AB0I00_30345 [Streptomyces sp. NPDC050803]|uniref:hypothetical protein n=1 Tax=unclassified Streptomyces TaxID=2593676 RepID=UPI003425FF92